MALFETSSLEPGLQLSGLSEGGIGFQPHRARPFLKVERKPPALRQNNVLGIVGMRDFSIRNTVFALGGRKQS